MSESTNRRDFIKTASAATGAALLGSSIRETQAGTMTPARAAAYNAAQARLRIRWAKSIVAGRVAYRCLQEAVDASEETGCVCGSDDEHCYCQQTMEEARGIAWAMGMVHLIEGNVNVIADVDSLEERLAAFTDSMFPPVK